MARRLRFLDLPLGVRKLVYRYMGMSGCTVDLNYNRLRLYAEGIYPDYEIQKQQGCFHDGDLKITRCEDCRTLEEYWTCGWDQYLGSRYLPDCDRDTCRGAPFVVDWLNGRYGSWMQAPEQFKTILGSNHFRICRSSPYGFAPFHDLPRDMLNNLGTLTIRLDGELVESLTIGGEWERLDQLRPIILHTEDGMQALAEWKKLVQRLTENIQPDHLTLYLIASVKDIETAESILEPLHQLPVLKDCGLWLSREHVPELKSLAQETIKRLTTSKQPFKYLDLPIEIRWRILEYTDLVYNNILEWKPPLSSLGRVPRQYCTCTQYVDVDVIEDGPYSRGIHFAECVVPIVDATSLEADLEWYVDRSVRHCCNTVQMHSPCARSRAGFCECIYHCDHSAYSSCALPGQRGDVPPLFLVSKQVLQDSIPVFYRRNKFLVSPPGVTPLRWVRDWPRGLRGPRSVIPMRRVELSLFFSSLQRNALQHIRYLEWLLPRLDNYTRAPRSTYLDYLDTIELMAQAMNLSQLTLVLNLRVVGRYIPQTQEFSRPERTRSEGAVYDRILQPLTRLTGLKDFFVYLRRVRKKHAGTMYRPRDIWAYDNDEMKYEKAVMGADYDSRARGKSWLERFASKVMDSLDERSFQWEFLDDYSDYYDPRTDLDG